MHHYHTINILNANAGLSGTSILPEIERLKQEFKPMKDFNSLGLCYKSDILKRQADYLLTMEIEEYSVKLYAWDHFFLEQYFDSEGQVTRIKIADKLDMQKYLKNICLADLGYPTVV